MRICLTGSRGFLGSYVLKRLQKDGHIVTEFDKKIDKSQNLLTNDFKFLSNIDCVIHMAAEVGLKSCYEDPVLAVENNVLGTTRLLEACKTHRVKRFISTSTWAVKGNLENPYDLTKLAAENMARSYHKLHGLPVIVLRLGTAYGIGMSDAGVIPSYIRAIKANKPLVVQGRGIQLRQFTNAKDIAEAFNAAVTKGKIGETYYIVAPEVVSIKQLAETFDSEIKYKEARPGDEDYEILCSCRAKADLGWEAKVTLKEGIEEMKK